MSVTRHIAITFEFCEPLITARGAIARRHGFLHVFEDDGKTAVSESALLPEFGTEHFEHAERILNGESAMFQSAPSVLFGVDCIRYALENRAQREIRVPIAKLLPSGTNDDVLAAARQAVIENCNTVKLKVGFRSLENDIELVNMLALEIPELTLRLDANLGWTPDDVNRFAETLPREIVEWIEDPCRSSMHEWKALQDQVGIPFACDEAFSETEILAYTGALGFKTLVMKPARMGTIGDRKALRDRMHDEEIVVVLSSMFESSIGLAHLAHLSTEWSVPDVAQGLGTLHMLTQDTLEPGLSIEAGHLVVPPLLDLAKSLRPELKNKLGL